MGNQRISRNDAGKLILSTDEEMSEDNASAQLDAFHAKRDELTKQLDDVNQTIFTLEQLGVKSKNKIRTIGNITIINGQDLDGIEVIPPPENHNVGP